MSKGIHTRGKWSLLKSTILDIKLLLLNITEVHHLIQISMVHQVSLKVKMVHQVSLKIMVNLYPIMGHLSVNLEDIEIYAFQ